MTITTGVRPPGPPGPPKRTTPVTLLLGFLTGGVIGGSLSAFVVGINIEKVPLTVAGLAVPAGYALLYYLSGAPRRAREARVVPRTALAMIESLEAVRGETSDVPVRFDATVAPEDGPAFRVEFKQDINLVELSDYRASGMLVVQYPPDKPWQVRIVKRPTPEWEERLAGARIDSAPGPAMTVDDRDGCALGILAVLGLLLGVAAVVFPYRVDLFDGTDTAAGPSVSSSTSSSSSSSTTVVSSATSTVTLGAGQSFLDEGELSRAIESLTQADDQDKGPALTVVVQERVLSVVYVPSDSQAPGFDLASLPYERFPALVEEAISTLGVQSPDSWQITAENLTADSVTIRVGVTGPEGTASLEADERGDVVARTPAGD
ncbi:hypothetical protein ACFXAZ_20580 [Streptomyces sp. NPDC059477]|uniref:hypothetical protein n=1 Tax=Streptomyces sp. NPDC059477 TaxID=3346847 RepID=UPI00368E01C9